MQEKITNFIKELISDKTGKPVTEINDDITLTDLEIDSMAVLDIIFELEHEYDINFPENQGQIKTLNDMVDLTTKLLNKNKAE